MLPEFSTVPPSSAAYPPRPTVMMPALVTGADAPLPVKVRFPAMKSLSEIPSVDATKLPVLTTPLWVIAMPFGLTR